MNIPSKYILPLLVAILLQIGSVAKAQELAAGHNYIRRAVEAVQLSSPVGVLRDLAPTHHPTWQLLGEDEEAEYLRAIAEGALHTAGADLQLLHFIERYPHSAYLPYAMVRLGEVYYLRGLYDSVSYWLGQVDTRLLPPSMAASTEYYHAYSLLQVGRNAEAITLLRPLTYSKEYRHDATFYLGYLLLKEGAVEEGMEQLQKVEAHPTYGGYATAYIAEALLSKGRYTEALQRATNLLEQGGQPTVVRASLLRTAGLVSAVLGNAERTVHYMEQYFELGPQEAGQLERLTLGQALFESGFYQRAIEPLAQVYRVGQQNFMSQLALYYSGLAHLALQEQREALQDFDKATQIASYAPLTEATTYNAALTAYSLQPGRLSDGTARLARFLTLYPSSRYQPQVVGHLSDAFLNEPNVTAALAEMEKINPLPKALSSTRERVRLRQANKALSSGNTSQASRQYDDIIKRGSDPVSVAEAYLWKGELAYRDGDYNTAISATQSYLSQRPRELELNPNAYFTLGYAYFNQKRYAEAEQNFNAFIKEKKAPSPDERTDIYNRLGDIAQQRSAYATAEEHYRRAEEAGGTDASYALFSRGMLRGLQKDYTGKIQLLGTLLHRYPSAPQAAEAMYEQGRTLALQGRHREARSIFQQFQEKYSNSTVAPKVGLQLALSYFNDNHLPEAANAYEEVIRRYPHSQEAKTALLNLKSIAIELNQVERFNQLAKSAGGGTLISGSEMDSLTFLAAEKLLLQGAPDEALSAMQNYLTQYPTGAFAPRATYSVALLYYKKGNYNEAIRTLTPLAPQVSGTTAVELYLLQAKAHDQLAEPGRAAEAYLNAARNEANLEARSNHVATSLERAAQSESYNFIYHLANDVANGTLQVTAPVQSQLFGVAAEAYARSNRKAEALQYAERVLALPEQNGNHTMATVVKGLSLYDQGRYPAVQQSMQALIERGSSNAYWLARAFILLADSYEKQGDAVTARTYLESVQSSYRNSDDGILEMIRTRLARL